MTCEAGRRGSDSPVAGWFELLFMELVISLGDERWADIEGATAADMKCRRVFRARLAGVGQDKLDRRRQLIARTHAFTNIGIGPGSRRRRRLELRVV